MLVRIVFGWPAILTALALCLTGLLAKRPLLVALGAALFIGPGLYLSGSPAINWLGFLLPACLFGSAYALRQKKTGIAWLLTLPALLVSAWLAVVVLTQ